MVWLLGYGENVDSGYMFAGELCPVSYQPVIKIQAWAEIGEHQDMRWKPYSLGSIGNWCRQRSHVHGHQPLLPICWEAILNLPCKPPVDFNSVPGAVGQKLLGSNTI